jgi:hypothetical protein
MSMQTSDAGRPPGAEPGPAGLDRPELPPFDTTSVYGTIQQIARLVDNRDLALETAQNVAKLTDPEGSTDPDVDRFLEKCISDLSTIIEYEFRQQEFAIDMARLAGIRAQSHAHQLSPAERKAFLDRHEEARARLRGQLADARQAVSHIRSQLRNQLRNQLDHQA